MIYLFFNSRIILKNSSRATKYAVLLLEEQRICKWFVEDSLECVAVFEYCAQSAIFNSLPLLTITHNATKFNMRE